MSEASGQNWQAPGSAEGQVLLFIGGNWRKGTSAKRLPVVNPATETVIGHVACATQEDLDDALAAAEKAWGQWRGISAYERSKIMRRAASLVRDRADTIGATMTAEQGKPLAESKGEAFAAADVIEWFAEEGRRAYGRIVPSRDTSVRQLVVKQPIGPVAAFTPWNFPLNQMVRKVSAALAAGCSIIVKPSEETPASAAHLAQAFADAGLPPGVLNLVFGDPEQISSYLIPHKVIRKVSFTGSTDVGKRLAGLAGSHMKKATMELGGHAPVVVAADADMQRAVKFLLAAKFRNAGQVCTSPTRLLLHADIHDEFLKHLVAGIQGIRIGDGFDPETRMGPLANGRRITAMERLVDDAVGRGGKILTGGQRLARPGYFYPPTVLADVPVTAEIMNTEPFGPILVAIRFSKLEDALAECNRLAFGLASYAFTESARTAQILGDGIEAGMTGINHSGLALPELPFGGIRDSGYGSEGGLEALEDHLVSKLISHAT